jgi:RNA polymerase sigma factor (sigma-70 family)
MSPSTGQTIGTVSLLVRLCSGMADPLHWNEFVGRFWAVIFGQCRKRLSEHDAQDVTQQVLIGLFRSFQKNRYDPAKGTFRPWLFVVTRNAIDTHFRNRGNRPHAQLFEDDRVADDLTNEIATRELLSIALERVKGSENASDWELFELIEQKGLATRDVATQCGVTPAHVYRVVYRLRMKLAEAIRELDDATGG